MKPTVHSSRGGRRRFPPTDYFFQSGTGDWRGYSSNDDDEFRDFYSLSREFLAVAARERAKEMAVFAVVVVTAAWPVIYMIATVVGILRGHPTN